MPRRASRAYWPKPPASSTTATKKRDLLLAEKLNLEEEMEQLREKVANVEETVMADWDSDRIEQSHLREQLNDIASDVSKIVYALEGNDPVEEEESSRRPDAEIRRCRGSRCSGARPQCPPRHPARGPGAYRTG